MARTSRRAGIVATERRGRALLLGGALAAFLAIVTWVLSTQDVDDVIDDLSMLGTAFALVLAVHVAVIACDGAAWRCLLSAGPGPGLWPFLGGRWVREAVNQLFPVASFGGDVVGMRILAGSGVPPHSAVASVVLDKATETLSQIPFTVLGLLALIVLRGDGTVSRHLAVGLAILVELALALMLSHRAGLGRALASRLLNGLRRRHRVLLVRLRRFADALRSLYRPATFLRSVGWHLTAWTLGAGEVWVALRFMGFRVGLGEALALESLGQAITSMGFMVPAGFGVQEAAYVAISAAVGLPMEAAVALCLVKRARQVALGLPAVITWEVLELRRRLGPLAGQGRDRGPAQASASNAYLRRLTRIVLRPLRGTPLSPNHITGLRIATGLGACTAGAVGQPHWSHWAAVLWTLSAILDRGDGEFARMTGKTTEWGHRLDYYGDVVINALIFLAMGIGLRDAAFGHWLLLGGIVAAAGVAVASILSEHLEVIVGAKTIPCRWGFDFDDTLFILVPAIWLGMTAPLVVGAAVGAPAFGFFVWCRLSRLAGQKASTDLSPAQ